MNLLDEAFFPLSTFVETSSDIEGAVAEPGKGVAMTIERAEIEMPIEMDIVVDESGKVHLGAVPPLYYVETTVLPVFHQVKLTLEVFNDTSDGN